MLCTIYAVFLYQIFTISDISESVRVLHNPYIDLDSAKLLDILICFVFHLVFPSLIFIMTSIPGWQQVQEAEYFNWRCIMCHDLAKSPLHLEQQFQERHGIYWDIDSCEWVKCNKCFNPYVHCLIQNPPANAEYICTFMSCNLH